MIGAAGFFFFSFSFFFFPSFFPFSIFSFFFTFFPFFFPVFPFFPFFHFFSPFFPFFPLFFSPFFPFFTFFPLFPFFPFSLFLFPFSFFPFCFPFLFLWFLFVWFGLIGWFVCLFVCLFVWFGLVWFVWFVWFVCVCVWFVWLFGSPSLLRERFIPCPSRILPGVVRQRNCPVSRNNKPQAVSWKARFSPTGHLLDLGRYAERVGALVAAFAKGKSSSPRPMWRWTCCLASLRAMSRTTRLPWQHDPSFLTLVTLHVDGGGAVGASIAPRQKTLGSGGEHAHIWCRLIGHPQGCHCVQGQLLAVSTVLRACNVTSPHVMSCFVTPRSLVPRCK